jgi:NADH-quinone oxidoreductase subunit M
MSLLLLVLTFFLGCIAVLCSWSQQRAGQGFFHLNLAWIVAGLAGVFVAVDLFVFYFAWELMLIPMFFLIAIWGHERRVYASIKFFVFTQLSGLLMLVAILALVFLHYRATGVYTFDSVRLAETGLRPDHERWIALGFVAAFAVKLPVVPFHTWLADAHTEAPTAGSVLLAGLLLKTGAYGLLRFVLPMFPAASRELAEPMMVLGVIGILYGALLASAQTDLKRLVAYTSVSHLGFVLVGIFSGNRLGLQGAWVMMLAHGLSTGALFMLVGALQQRMHTRDLDRMGGLWATTPRLGGAMLLFVMASMGLPGLGDFIGEYLTLQGAWSANRAVAIAAAAGVVASTTYGLRMLQGVLQGGNVHGWKLPDLTAREWLMSGTMAAALLWLGLNPQPVLNASGVSSATPAHVISADYQGGAP